MARPPLRRPNSSSHPLRGGCLTANGVEHPITTEVQEGGFLVLLHPVGLLRGRSAYTVAISGLEDIAGRPLADRTWTFHTGAGPDLTRAQLVSWMPSGIGSPSSVLRATFDKPVFFQRSTRDEVVPANDFSVVTASAVIEGSINFSDDGKTLTYVPNRTWPLNTHIAVSVNRFYFHDWTGADFNERQDGYGRLVVPEFTTSSSPAAALPRVEMVNPYRDAADAPVNVQIQARFAEPVVEGSLSRVRLQADGQSIPARAALGADGRTVTVLPSRGLDANRAYTVIVEGVQNADGAVQEGAELWSFRTGASLLTGSSEGVAYPIFEEGLSVRIELPRQVNPLSVDSQAFDLRARGIVVAVEAQADPAGRSIVVKPAQPVSGNMQWSLSSTTLQDWAGNSIRVNASFTSGAGARRDTEPPRVQSLLPAPGSVMNWNDTAAIVFDKQVVLRDGEAGVNITRRGTPVSPRIQLAQTGNALRIRPMTDWLPGETYDVEVRAILDRSGNEAEPVGWSFTIAGDGSTDTLRLALTSTTPAQNAVGVPADSPIVLEFSKPVMPADSPQYPSLYTASNSEVYATANLLRPVYSGNKVQLSTGPFPSGVRVSARAAVQDMSGFTLTAGVDFFTAASPDKTPPQIESIAPPAASRLAPGINEFILRFSEPVTYIGQWASFSAGGQMVPPISTSFPVQGDGRTVAVAFDLPANTVGTLNLLAGIEDLAGNRLSPLSLEYSTGPADDSMSKPLVRPVRLEKV